MRMFYKADLRNICNNKLIGDGDKNIGLDGIYVKKADWGLNGNKTINGTDFSFSIEDFDNVECYKQVLPVSATADFLHIIGFAYWGETTELFRVEYSDGTEERVAVSLPDWSASMQNYPWNDICRCGDVETVYSCQSSGAMLHTIYLHRATVELHGISPVKEIIFPDNFLFHVFALTLENSGKRGDI